MWGHLYRFTITNRDLRTNTRGHVRGHAENVEPCKPDYWEADMANGWTPERRARQAEMIRTWKPWQQATGPRTPDGKAKASRNAYKGGHWLMLRELSRLVNAEIKAGRALVERVRPE